MPLTTASILSNAVVTRFESIALRAIVINEVWSRFVDWEPIHEGSGGSSFDRLTFGDLEPATTPLTEDSDLVPTVITDGNLTVTPAEYGNSVAPTRVARWQSRVKLRDEIAYLVGNNRARSVDRLIRNGILSGTNVRYPGTKAARTDLNATNDLVSADFLRQLWADAYSAGIEPFDGGDEFVAIIPASLAADISRLPEFREPQYRRTGEGLDKLLGGVGRQFSFMGIRFIVHRFGKLYLSGGALAQAPTTLAAPAARGATTITVSSATGLAPGDYITIGALESRLAEQVQITAVSGTTLTIVGGGGHANNIGLAYAHAAGEPVTEAANVAAIPIIGKNSVWGVYGDEWGRTGKIFVKTGLDQADRFVYHGWVWYGGVAVWNARLIRGECAVSGGIRGTN
jgi:N4-gp56 family major capsid protein